MKSPLPKISIITVVYNRVHDIEYTIKSVVHQTYPHIEFIVIDGQSIDGTIQIIKKYSTQIHHFISEPDSGIYDAMNKGLSVATGDYILFINGGDQLHHHQTLEQISNTIFISGERPDIIYGECMLIHADRSYFKTRSEFKQQTFPTTLNHQSFIHGTNVSHQSFIVKNKIAPLYDLKYKWSSDVDWMLNCLKTATTVKQYSGIISDFVIGDSTEKHKIASLKERFIIMCKHYGTIRTIQSHLYLSIKNIQ